MATLKNLVGNAGAGLDKSHGSDTVYDVLSALITEHNNLVAQYNQLLADYNAETVAAHTTSTATTITPAVSVE